MQSENNYRLTLGSIEALLEQLNVIESRDDGDVRLMAVGNSLYVTRLRRKKELVTIEVPVRGHLPFPLQIKWKRLKQLLFGHSDTVQIVLCMRLNGSSTLHVDNMLVAFEPLTYQMSLPLEIEDVIDYPHNRLLDRIAEIDAENMSVGVLSSEVMALRYERDRELVTLIKLLRGGKCQICNFSFKTLAGEDYAECHHLEHLANGGLDTSKNMLVLCANHHRQFHHGHVELLSHSTDNLEFTIDGIIYNCSI